MRRENAKRAEKIERKREEQRGGQSLRTMSRGREAGTKKSGEKTS
jgi:hypothetical protein